jgi:hypothetical protein
MPFADGIDRCGRGTDHLPWLASAMSAVAR